VTHTDVCPACGLGRRVYVLSEAGRWWLFRERRRGGHHSRYATMAVREPTACPACGAPANVGTAADLRLGTNARAAELLALVFDGGKEVMV